MTRLLTAVILLVIIIAFSAFWWMRGISPQNPQAEEQKVFVVEKGANVRQIGNKLKKEGLIKDPIIFFLFIRKEGLDRNIQAGSYRLSPSMTLPEIINELQTGRIDIWVTFPEGIRAEEIADILQKNTVSYDESWRKQLIDNEGFLFPDTYLIPEDASVERIVEIMKNNFDAQIQQAGLDLAEDVLNRTITIASLIERESKNEEDHGLVASVIENRLEIGMPLQIDATVQYAVGYTEQEGWWKIPLPEDLEVESEYNTYKYPGLPPTPIANPGISAIRAAANPASSDYLYYVNDENGKLHFARTLAEHEANIEKYLN